MSAKVGAIEFFCGMYPVPVSLFSQFEALRTYQSARSQCTNGRYARVSPGTVRMCPFNPITVGGKLATALNLWCVGLYRRDQFSPGHYQFHGIEKCALAGAFHGVAKAHAALFHALVVWASGLLSHIAQGFVQRIPSVVSNATTAISLNEKSVNFEPWDHLEEEGAREAWRTGDTDCSLLASKGASQARFIMEKRPNVVCLRQPAETWRFSQNRLELEHGLAAVSRIKRQPTSKSVCYRTRACRRQPAHGHILTFLCRRMEHGRRKRSWR